mgnify:CR=1 FL=1
MPRSDVDGGGLPSCWGRIVLKRPVNLRIMVRSDDVAFITSAALFVGGLKYIKAVEEGKEEEKVRRLSKAHSVDIGDRVESSIGLQLTPSMLEMPHYDDLCDVGKSIIESVMRLGILTVVVIIGTEGMKRFEPK